jgi:large subunit ribosomal protein L29
MELKELRTQSAQDLSEQLVELRREQFNLRMQKGSGQQKQTHHFKRVKREIAQIKMLLDGKSSSAVK